MVSCRQRRARTPSRAILRSQFLPAHDSARASQVTYIAGEHVEDAWNCYPWDAAAYGRDVYEHEALARQCAHETPRPARGRRRLAFATIAAIVAAAAVRAC